LGKAITSAAIDRAAAPTERLREGVSAETVGGGVTVTMSVGVACSPQSERFDYAEVFVRADAALYRAKDLGRDRVCVDGRAEADVLEPALV
jgi:diguanylate cyclase (GGDEF)-like protein